VNSSATVSTETPEALIADLRSRLDGVDAELIELVCQRIELSRRIQDVRLAHGGRRTEHSRELKIVSRYVDGLGDSGSTLALTLLEMCRGRVA
jgi:chorismate mutase